MIEFKSNMMRAAVLAAVLAVDPAGAQERPGNFLDNLFGGQQRQQQPPSEDGELAVRINQLESQIRQLTGTIEQLQFRNQQLEQQLRAQGGNGVPPQANMQPQANMPPQTSMPPQGNIPPQAALPPPPGRPPQAAPLPPPVAAAPAPGPGRRGDAFDPSMNPSAPGAPRSLGGGAAPTQSSAVPHEPPPVIMADPPVGVPGGRNRGEPLDLSTLQGGVPGDQAQQGMLPPPPARNPNATGAVASVLPPSNIPKDYYDLAYGYVLRKDYAYAEDAFQTFLKKYPGDKLVPDAQFWLGESLYQRQKYDAAAEQFLALSTKNSAHPKAADALLRLGQSLAALNQKEMACATLAEVNRKYPRASNTVKQGVEREQKRVRC